jgi:hypothetical protein
MLTLLVCSACSSVKPAAPTISTAEVTDLAARRAQALHWLHDYRERGVYPTDNAGMPLSVFRDGKGVRCPMAELIHMSGRDDLVDEVAKTANDVRLADVHTGPLYDWMLHSGLTLDEIAMVQGAMTFEEMREVQVEQEMILAAVRGQVAGKLAMAEVALRNDTSTALQHAADQVRAPFVASGPVVPATAKVAAEQARAMQARGQLGVMPRMWISPNGAGFIPIQ